MLNFDAFSLGDIQNCLHLLNECEAEGITDIRFVRQRLASHTNIKLRERKTGNLNRSKTGGEPAGGMPPEQRLLGVCPECEARQVTHTVVEGEVVATCRKCRWSQYFGPITSEVE